MEANASAAAQHRPEIDGLRAIAILPVVLYHVGLTAQSGFVGVDVFFAISGFLISGIIFRELDSDIFSFSKFWERRVRRILPVLLFFTAVILLTGWLILHPRDFADLGEEAAYALAGLANFKMKSLSGGYWAPQSENIVILHTWSLAVEEQFYLFMPFLLWSLHRWLRAQVGYILVLMFITSLTLSLVSGTTHPEFNFYLLPTRAWEMLIGCIGAYALHRKSVRSRSLTNVAGLIGLAMILFSSFCLPKSEIWPNIWTLVPTLGTVLILISPDSVTESRRSLLVRLLSFAPLRFIGLISYSLYLWHWPVIVFFKEYHPETINTFDRWFLVAASILLASLSWRFVEQPFRNRLKSFRVDTRSLMFGAGAIWACLLISAVLGAKSGPSAEKEFNDKLPPNVARIIFERPGVDSILKFDATSHLREGGVPINLRNRVPRCVVLGSSHGQYLGPVVTILSKEYDIPCVMLTQTGTCGIFAGSNTSIRAWHRDNTTKRERDEIVKAYIKMWKPDLVIIGGRWEVEVPLGWGTNPDESTANFRKAFTETVAWLERYSTRVVVLGQVPLLPLPGDQDNAIGIWKRYRANNNSMPTFREPAVATESRHRAISLFRNYAGTRLTILDPEPLFENGDGTVRYYSDSGILYFDDNHLNSLGVNDLKTLLSPFFRKLATGDFSEY